MLLRDAYITIVKMHSICLVELFATSRLKLSKLTGHGKACVFSGSIKKPSSLIVSVVIFSQYFLNRFCPM